MSAIGSVIVMTYSTFLVWFLRVRTETSGGPEASGPWPGRSRGHRLPPGQACRSRASTALTAGAGASAQVAAPDRGYRASVHPDQAAAGHQEDLCTPGSSPA